ncbi:MAG: 3-oxoacyl-ACP reductase FabG [Paludibacteraceae bacterium]|jgi:3-oxoacyl-[acyl-carrier protein] reductase|nr:3-oxoacyl-ACP reductase FabG [Paludibacteraceae bacterium]
MNYALITGASRGIGRAVAERLAKDGYAVIINYHSNTAAAEETKSAIEAAGGQAELLPFDVSDGEAIEAALTAWDTAHEGEHISVLVNNAGIRKDGLLVFMDEDDWHQVMQTTTEGFYYTTHHVLSGMLRARKGRIVNITSVSGVSGLPGQANYSAAKAALIGATKALSKEVAARKVTVNAVAPGFIATDMTADLDEAELKKMIPAGRFGQPEEVAALVSFLCSDEAAYITGQVITIAGGMG